MFKQFFAAAFAVVSLAYALPADAQQRVDGYTRRDGTYVQPYTRSTPNNSYNDNWGVRGNQNPYTGQMGTGSPTWNDRSPSYNQQHYGSPMYQSPSPYGRRN